MFSQSNKVKFGKITPQELSLKSCEFDPDAGAVVLSETGQMWFDVNVVSGSFDIIQERHVRIKIFNSTEYDQADIEIPYYTGEDDGAHISNLKAHTIIPSGKNYEEIKVDKGDIFDEKTSNYYSTVKFSFPQINDGVIIEYKYRLTSSFLSVMKRWDFQHDIPVLYTWLELDLPEFYESSVELIGHSTSQVRRNSSTSGSAGFISTRYEFEGSDLPGIKDEKYGTNAGNYTTKMRVVIQSYKIPGYMRTVVAGDYNELNKTICESERFGQIHTNHGFLEDFLSGSQRSKNPEEDVRLITDYVRKNVNYVSNNSFYPNQSARLTSKGEPSNEGAVNMLLILTLKEAGYNAEPLILGSRGYRKPHPFNPDFSDFDHMLAYVTLNERKQILADATSNLPGGKPQAYVFNGNGFIVSKDQPRKVDISSLAEAKIMLTEKWNVEPGTQTKASMNLKCNYLGIHAIADEEGYSESTYENWVSDIAVGDVSDFESTANPRIYDINYSMESADVPGGDLIYLTPVFQGFLDPVIFRRESRLTPLDLPYKINTTNIIEYNIPDGYVIESAPKSMRVNSKDEGMSLTYMVNQTAEKVSINARFKVETQFYLPEQYADIRAFFSEVEKVLNEKIVLKKG